MARKRLPLGIQTFRIIRDVENNYVYVDKTKDIYRLIESSRYNFLSRPRRFGKSLMLDTISELYKGNKTLFEGLYIYDKWDWSKQYPVIMIDFSVGRFDSKDAIDNSLNVCLTRACNDLGLNTETCYNKDYGYYLENIIAAAYNKYNMPVVVLIDEYDKPVLNNITKNENEMARVARKVLNNLYSAIKGSSQHIEFTMLTGVGKFTKMSIFSGLNNLVDISIQPKFASIVGYTQAELEHYFADYLTPNVDKQKIKQWYDGYNYLGDNIYNPFDILLFFNNDNEFSNYWWKTGNPSFLIELLKRGTYYLPDLENITVGEEVLDSFDVENINLTALLWQTGYLTFDKKIDLGYPVYKLKVPNLEVQNSLNILFLDYLTSLKENHGAYAREINAALRSLDFQELQSGLNRLFAAIPYTNYVNNNLAHYEGYYASVIYTLFSSLGFRLIAEDTTSKGRIDMTMFTPHATIIIEFKVDKSAQEALAQIQQKDYSKKYKHRNQAVYLMGIGFNSDSKQLDIKISKS